MSLYSSLISSLDNNEFDDVRSIQTRILCNPSIISKMDTKPIVTSIFNSAMGEEKIQGYNLLKILLESKINRDDVKLTNFFERIVTLIESTNDLNEGFSLLSVIRNVYKLQFHECIERIEKNISKIIHTASRLLSTNVDLGKFYLSILHLFLTSTSRNLLNQLFHSIRKACIRAILIPDLTKLAAKVIALCNAGESPEYWERSLRFYCIEASTILKNIGINELNIDMSKINNTSSSNNNNNNSNTHSTPDNFESIASYFLEYTPNGTNRALKAERVFAAIIDVIIQMFKMGNIAGPIQIDLFLIVLILNHVLPISLQLTREDAKLTVINSDSEISTFDFALILPLLKKKCLFLLLSIFRFSSLGLSTVASGIIRPLSSFLSLNKEHPQQAVLAFLCFSQAIGCFPTIILKSGAAGIATLINLFEKEMSFLTSNDHSEEETIRFQVHAEEEVQYTETLMSTIEALLIHCGPMMSKPAREAIEFQVARGLLCLCKGVTQPSLVKNQYPWKQDRRVKRDNFENIRFDVKHQIALLTLACTEILSPHIDGKMSGNINLLRSAAEICGNNGKFIDLSSFDINKFENVKKKSTSCHLSSSISFVSHRILLVINSILIPNSLPLTNSFLQSNEMRELISNRIEKIDANIDHSNDDVREADGLSGRNIAYNNSINILGKRSISSAEETTEETFLSHAKNIKNKNVNNIDETVPNFSFSNTSKDYELPVSETRLSVPNRSEKNNQMNTGIESSSSSSDFAKEKINQEEFDFELAPIDINSAPDSTN